MTVLLDPMTTRRRPVPDAATVDAQFARIVDELTRRGFLGGALGSAALLGLAACGSGSGPDQAVASDSGTRTVTTIHGPIRVPAHPTRVVTVSFIGTANLLDLGLTPVGGVTASVQFLPQYSRQLAAMTIVADAAGQIQLETVASLRPDLIVGSDWAEASKALLPYDKLRQIAPTALVPQAASVGNWTEQAHDYADAVNRLGTLAPLQAAYTDEQQRIRTSYGDQLATQKWVLINASQTGWYRYSTQASHCKVLAGAGVRFTPSAEKQAESFEQLSFEQLGQLADADVIGLGRAADPTWQNALTSQPLFRDLPAVKAGHLYDLKWFFPSSYGTARALLDQLDPILSRWRTRQEPN